MPSVNDQLRDAAVRHQIYLTRYSNRVVREMLSLLDAADKDLLRRLRSRSLPGARTPYQRERLRKLNAAIREMIRASQASIISNLRISLREISNYETAFATNSLNAAIVVDLEAVAPAVGTVYSAAMTTPTNGKYLKDWFANLTRAKVSQVNDAIRIGVVEGETIDQIITRLRGTRAANYRNGVLATSRRQAEAIARTSVNHMVNTARRSVFDRNADIVKGWQYVATLDGRTTDICMSLDGQVYATKEEGPTPPQHINCRSTISPVTKSWKELGIKAKDAPPATRASMNGQVSAKETYQTWLKKQPASFQDDVLGPTKGALFRRGGVTLDRFVDKAGKSYTIDALARREAAAFAAIGGGGG